MVVDALLRLLIRTQEYNFVVRSGVFEFPVAGRITADYQRTFISDLGSRFRFEGNAPTGTPPSESAMCQAAQDYHVEKQSRGRPAGSYNDVYHVFLVDLSLGGCGVCPARAEQRLHGGEHGSRSRLPPLRKVPELSHRQARLD